MRTQTPFNIVPSPLPLVSISVISSRIGRPNRLSKKYILLKNIFPKAFDTQVCVVAAWNTGNNLQQALNVPVINQDQCNALPLNFGRITESMMCAGALATGTGVCPINQGGSLYCNNRLEGVLSSGFGCGTVANNPGVYTQVNITFYLH